MRSQLVVAALRLRPLTLGVLCAVLLLPACGSTISKDGISTGSLGGTATRTDAQPRHESAAAPAWKRQAYGPPPAYAGSSQGYGQPYQAQPYQTQPYQAHSYQAGPQQTWHTSPRGTPVYGAPSALGYGTGTVEVQPGDTLYSISRRHGVSVASLVDSNHLSGIAIKPGQRLRLPAGTR